MSTEPDYSLSNSDVVTKYKTAGDISAKVLANIKALAVEGAKIIDLTTEGDRQLLEETSKIYKGKKDIIKGIAFPTSVSPNNVVAHLSPLPTDKEAEITLKAGDVVKITLGAQVDGFASIVGDTVVVGGGEVSGPVADAIAAAWYATEAAIRTIKPGNKNWDVTKIVDKVTSEYGVKALEGMLSNEQSRNVVDGKKRIILNPSESQRREFETFTFEEGEVYGVDILVSTGDGKSRADETPTTVYKKADITYQLKLRTSRATFSEVQKKAGSFPFSLRSLDDAKKARMGLQECQNHGLIIPYEVFYEKEGQTVVQFFTTIALTKTGTIKFAGPVTPDFAKIKTDKKVTDESVLDVLSKPLKASKKNKKKAADAAAAPASA
ncbi:Map2p [Sugiyamaella lignohabitans]|uniref:Map2p n=1 Tax=Sugiyamaella lignohabitans TaxID=796027 RepID=A0A167C1B5_9ASCO|nr:Map2p [Sugiyamaella lignohabitans]ANB11096.1 Map2p [Sugiyamaella lignohabitans]